MRHQGKPVKRWWFVRRGKQTLDELEPDHNFIFSNHWLERFQNRFNISLIRKTHCSQKPPTALESGIKKFHSSLLRLRNTGNFKASDLANMDQTPLPFVLDDGKTYEKKGLKEVWAQSGQSGLDKRQATVQLTVFADGVDRVRRTVIFRVKGLPISAKEYKVMTDESRSCIRKKLGVIRKLYKGIDFY